jgi:hypothetical protein
MQQVKHTVGKDDRLARGAELAGESDGVRDSEHGGNVRMSGFEDVRI